MARVSPATALPWALLTARVCHRLPPPGARCEANTFDGERCLYGALSDAIRRALRDYKQVTASCRQRDYYDDFLQR